LATFGELQSDCSEQAHKILIDAPIVLDSLSKVTLFAAYCDWIAALPRPKLDELVFAAGHDRFCAAHGLRGPSPPLEPREQLGHVMSMDAFRTHIADPALAARSATGVPRFGSLGPPPVRVLADADLRAILLSKRTDELTRGDNGTVWCFRSEGDPTEPLRGVALERLPCRLGLNPSRSSGAVGDDQWIAFVVEPLPVKWHQPTFADAGWNYLPAWVPGGVTQSLPGYNCGSGLGEVVGRGMVFGQWVSSRGPFRAEWPRLGVASGPLV
jgi:hypothetical protein